MLTHREQKCSMFRSSLFETRAARAILRHPLLLAAVFAAMTLGVAQRAAAQCPAGNESPLNCNANGLQVVIQQTSNIVNHGDTQFSATRARSRQLLR